MSEADDNQRELIAKWNEHVMQAVNNLLAAQVVSGQLPGSEHTGSRHKSTKRSLANVLRLLDSYTQQTCEI